MQTNFMKNKKPICEFCGEYTNCTCTWNTCSLCKKSFSNYDPDEKHQMYEYRGALGCSKCIDEVRKRRDFDRAEVMEIENHKTKAFRGLDMADDSLLGKANRKLLGKQIDIAKKESPITKRYERGE